MKKRILLIFVILALLLLVVGCSSSLQTLSVIQPTQNSVVIKSHGNSWEDNYAASYQVLFQLDKKVGVLSYTTSKNAGILTTIVMLEKPATIEIRKYAYDGSTKLNTVEVIVTEVK